MNDIQSGEQFRLVLREFSEASAYMSFSHMWRKNPTFNILLTWAHEHTDKAFPVLIEELDTCGWQAVDLIYKLGGDAIAAETSRSSKGYFEGALLLYRWAIRNGYETEKIRSDYVALRKKLNVEHKIDRIIRDLDRRRLYNKINAQDWKRARARLISIAKREPHLSLRHMLHTHLLWRGFAGQVKDLQMVLFISEIMTVFTPAPKKLATASTAEEIYFAWFDGDQPDEVAPQNEVSEN